MRVHRWTAALVIGAVIGAASVVVPVTSSPPAQAASKLETWSNALAKTFSAAGKVFGIEKSVGFLVGTGVLSFAGPLLSLIASDSGPSIGDVMKKLDGMENQLAAVKRDIGEISAEVDRVDVDVLMGTCTIETSALTALLTQVDAAEEEYAQIVEQMQHIDDMGDVRNLQKQASGFVSTVFGAGNTQATFVDGTALGSAILAAHNRLITTGGSRGVIESCGRAYLADWRQRAASSVADATLTDAGAWLGDEGYYTPVQDLVQFWQTVQAQAVFYLQQAAYMQAVQGYTTTVGPLSTAEAAQACANVVKGSDAYALCASTLRFTQNFHDHIVGEWQQAGIPYSSDDTVLALGTDVTGLTGPGATPIASTLWARDPSRFSGAAAGTPQTTSLPADQSFDGLSGWRPANSSQWKSLAAGLVASHTAATGARVTPSQNWRLGNEDDAYASSGVAAFAPVDVLGAMGEAMRANGEAQFGQTDALYWIPGETATRPLNYYSLNGGLGFPQGEFLDNSPSSVWGKHFLPYYAGPGLGIACMTVPVDGVLCDGATVGSWWVSRQSSTYVIESSNYFTKNYTGVAAWTVAPGSATVPGFSMSGRNAGCVGGMYCGIAVNIGVASMPPWLLTFTDYAGTVHDPAVEAASTYTQHVWPVLTLPQGAGCTTVWGVPSRCGDAMADWIAANVPDPTATIPIATATPVVTADATPGRAVCTAPAWSAEGGSGPAYGDVTWTAADASGTTVAVTAPWGAAVSIADDLVAAGSWSSPPTGLALACTVSATFGEAADTWEVPSAAEPTALVEDVWEVGAQPPSTVVDHPEATTAGDGDTVTLSATVAVSADPDDADSRPTATPDPTATATAPDPTTEETDAGARGGALALGGPVVASMVLASAVTPLLDSGASVRWERRAAGSDDWLTVEEPSSQSVSDGVSGPQSLGQSTMSSTLTLRGVDAEDRSHSYRAVFSTPEGTEIVTDEATIDEARSPLPWVWAAMALVIVLAGGALLLTLRRRRPTASRP